MNRNNLAVIPVLFAIICSILGSCGQDAVEEPAIFTPAQLKRLMLDGDIKFWQQLTQYYLEDSCRTGSILRLEDNPQRHLDSAFFAYYIPDASICDVAPDRQIIQRVKIVKNPRFKTTDSLYFIYRGDTTVKTIRLLTNQRLQLNVAGDGGKIIAVEEYRAVN